MSLLWFQVCSLDHQVQDGFTGTCQEATRSNGTESVENLNLGLRNGDRRVQVGTKTIWRKVQHIYWPAGHTGWRKILSERWPQPVRVECASRPRGFKNSHPLGFGFCKFRWLAKMVQEKSSRWEVFSGRNYECAKHEMMVRELVISVSELRREVRTKKCKLDDCMWTATAGASERGKIWISGLCPRTKIERSISFSHRRIQESFKKPWLSVASEIKSCQRKRRWLGFTVNK